MQLCIYIYFIFIILKKVVVTLTLNVFFVLFLPFKKSYNFIDHDSFVKAKVKDQSGGILNVAEILRHDLARIVC